VLAAQVLHGHAGIRFSQKADDLVRSGATFLIVAAEYSPLQASFVSCPNAPKFIDR
jgi:hypothetical protein